MQESQQDKPDNDNQVAPTEDELAAVNRLREATSELTQSLGQVIVGQSSVIEELLICLAAGGHCILEGVPGLAKTLMISTLARSLHLSFSRIQFTPDLMPADITGTEVIQEDKATGSRAFRFLHGPIFANVVLADEINRTPPKTQAALLEAMQERQVTAGGNRFALEAPFFVLATQNPIEQEGTYPLPEAQQDRFMFKVYVNYPSYEEELRIAERSMSDTAEASASVPAVLNRDDVLELQKLTQRVPIAPTILSHALNLVRATRPDDSSSPELIRRMVRWGAGPRALQCIVAGSKARAILKGHYHVSPEDVRAVAYPVLRHRLVTSYAAEAEGYTSDRIIDALLEHVQPHETTQTRNANINTVLGS
jgi:MoxR-like ATPase